MIERERCCDLKVDDKTERFITREIKPFDTILEFGKKIDSGILQKPFDLVVAELDRLSFDLNKTHLKKSSTFFGLTGFCLDQCSDFLIAKNLSDGISYILRQKQGERVSFVDGRFVKYGCDIWQGYYLSNRNEFILNEKYSYLDPDMFSPENLFRGGELIKSDRRNIYKLAVGNEVFYVKSSFINMLPRGDLDYYDQFESFPEISKLGSNIEADRFLQLLKLGVNVPKVVGYSTGQVNDCLVVEGIDGVYPTESDYLKNRFNIVDQDRQILAALTSLGLEKMGFKDFDDKIIKAGNLYLIDVDECVYKS